MFRLALTRLIATSAMRRNSSKLITHYHRYFLRNLSSQLNDKNLQTKIPLAVVNKGEESKRMGIQFRCKTCEQTLHKTFTRQSYEHGVVIIRCDSCSNLHLIADNLGWFNDITQDGKFKYTFFLFNKYKTKRLLFLNLFYRNVAQILQAKGETIHRVKVAPTNDDLTLKEEEQIEKLQLNEGTMVTS
jgi:hypothetical protein